jgi:nucleotide-binding universal stress UspA family protein
MSEGFRIVIAVDLEVGTEQLLSVAERYALALNAFVDAIHVAAPEPDFIGYPKIADPEDIGQEEALRASKAKNLRTERQKVQAYGEALQSRGVRVGRATTIQGSTLATILEELRNVRADLLILGAHHRHGALHRLWFGDSAVEAVKRAPCAVLVVPVDE